MARPALIPGAADRPPPSLGSSSLRSLTPRSQLPSTTQIASSDLVPIRRAPRACHRCRSRKVRCDVTHRRGDCTNCLLDGTECRVGGKLGPGCTKSINPPPKRVRWPRRSNSDQALEPAGSEEGHALHISISDESFRHPVFYADGGRFTAAHRERETEKDYGQAPVSRSSEPSPELFSRPKGAANLPDFIQAFCVTNPNDLDLLRQRGVFNLPEPTFQQTILDRYAEFFQPILPVVDYAAFYGVVTGTRPGPRVSLLLYYAVMFAGVGAMEADLVLRQAYMSKKAVRELFYDKAQTLFDMNVEKDRVAICQASLLLLGWASKDNLKDATFWLSTAIAQAHAMSLYRDSQVRPRHGTTKGGQPNIRRLLWWGILLKECDSCMSVCQPPRVWPFATPMLGLDDFGFEQSDVSSLGATQDPSSRPVSPQLSPLQALACIQKATLCRHIYRVMRYIHEDNPSSSRPGSGSLCPAMRECLAAELYEWHANIPVQLEWRALLRPPLVAGQRSLAWMMAVVELIYWAAHTVLYNTALLPSRIGYKVSLDPTSRRCIPEGDYGWCFLRKSATDTTEVLEQLTACDLTKFLPPSTLTNICLTGSTLFRDIAGAYGNVSPDSLRKFELCVEASKVMADLGPGLRETVAALQHVRSVLGSRALGMATSAAGSDLTSPSTGLEGFDVGVIDRLEPSTGPGSMLDSGPNLGIYTDMLPDAQYSAEDFDFAGQSLFDFNINSYGWA